jgi:hypothetical protein
MGRGGVVAGLLVAVVGLVGCGRGGAPVATTAPIEPGTWRTLPASPLSPRTGAASAWTGRELVVFGGTDPSADFGATSSSPGSVVTAPASSLTATATTAGAPGTNLTAPARPTPPRPVRAPGARLDGAAYDPAAATWRTIPSAPVPDGYTPAALTADGPRLTVAFGRGTVCVANDVSPDPTGAWFDADRNRWTAIPASPVAIPCGAAGAWVGDQLWIPNGDQTLHFDATSGRWSISGSTDVARSGYGVTDVHAVGGQVVQLGIQAARRLDPATGQWSDLPTPPVETSSAAVAGAKLYAWDGGQRSAAVLDSATWQWTRLPDAPIAPRSGAVVVSLDGDLFVWGGLATPLRNGPTRPSGEMPLVTAGPVSLLTDGAVYRTTTNGWQIVDGSPLTGRTGAAAAAGTDRLFVWGGTSLDADGHSLEQPLADGAEYRPPDPGQPSPPSTASTTTTAPNNTFPPVQSAVASTTTTAFTTTTTRRSG